MSSRNYPRLSIEEFGQHLLDSGDLDPVYIALFKMVSVGATMDTNHLYRWLVAYWCLYHVGAACWISEHKGDAFWDQLMKAAVNEEVAPPGGRWPRGHERRHWRGQQAVDACIALRNQYKGKPEYMVSYIAGAPVAEGATEPFEAVAARVREHRSFGPWIAFKVGDMLDCLGIQPVMFENAAIFMFDSPRENALRIWREKARVPVGAKIKDESKAISEVVGYLQVHFRHQKAPPAYGRNIGLQEIETILCKHGSHLSGHYPKFNDIVEIDDGLKEWSKVCKTAMDFRKWMPGRS